jgi:hypothetical protein
MSPTSVCSSAYGGKMCLSPSLATPPTTGVGENAEKKEPSYTVGGNVN